MFKRIKESEKLQRFKELWNDTKTHSIMVLSFWLIFMAVLIVFVRLTATPSTNTTSNEPLATSFESIKNYEFSYVQSTNELNGQVYDDSMLFILNNHRYYYKDDVYLINGDTGVKQDLDLGWLKINAKMLNNLLAGLNGTDINGYTQYVVPLDRFINLYEIDTDADLTKAMTYSVVVNVYKKDDVINKVVLDMTNYRLFRFNDSKPYVVSLYFYNINKINDFTSDFDKIVGGK